MTPTCIKTIRKCLDLTQRQFGAMVGKSESTVKRWESGRHRMDQTTDKLLMMVLKGGEVCVRDAKDLLSENTVIDRKVQKLNN